MTDAEWLACTDPDAMLRFLRGKASDRKLRLFAVACVRRIWRRLPDKDCRNAVGVAERFAEGLAQQADRVAAHKATRPVAPRCTYGRTSRAPAWDAAYYLTEKDAGKAASGASRVAIFVVSGTPGILWGHPEGLVQTTLVRDLFGNPFRPMTLDPAWRTADVLSLAQAAYDNRLLPSGTLDPARLLLLADALEDAGCASAELLGHLRSDGPHVRGCWALDLVLGLE